MSHNFVGKNIGIGITGSYCTYKKVFEELRRLADTKANIFTIFSDNASTTDTRFGKSKDFLKLAKEISNTAHIILPFYKIVTCGLLITGWIWRPINAFSIVSSIKSTCAIIEFGFFI